MGSLRGESEWQVDLLTGSHTIPLLPWKDHSITAQRFGSLCTVILPA